MDNKQILINLRKLIIRDRAKKKSFRKIAIRYAVSVGAVQHIWKKNHAYGSNCKEPDMDMAESGLQQTQTSAQKSQKMS